MSKQISEIETPICCEVFMELKAVSEWGHTGGFVCHFQCKKCGKMNQDRGYY